MFIMYASGKHLNESGGTVPLELIQNMYKEDPEIGLKEMEEWLYEGKREHYRKPFFTVVDFTTRGHAFKDFIKNISPGGVFIETSIPFNVGQELSLTFALPNCQKHIKITGEVVRITPQGIGVKFGMLKQQQETIQRKTLAERRKHERFRPRVSVFALLNKPLSNMGEIIDISIDGLSFRYSADEGLPKGSFVLDILCVDDGFYLAKLPSRTAADFEVGNQMRRRGVQFGRLTNKQSTQLKFFIRTYTAGEA
jgi:uncharacterized protein (TIGR02266 family)